jgi:hypothetical protein
MPRLGGAVRLVASRAAGSFLMRTESDVHGPHGSSPSACQKCGLPLHPEIEVCPFCEQDVAERPAKAHDRRGRRRPAPPERMVAGVPERTLLVAGTCVFASLAVIGIAISALV